MTSLGSAAISRLSFFRASPLIVAALVATALLSACSKFDPSPPEGQQLNRTTTGAIGGTVVGAGLGAIIGSAAGEAGAGMAIGAAAGAAAGGGVGYALDTKDEALIDQQNTITDQARRIKEQQRELDSLRNSGLDNGSPQPFGRGTSPRLPQAAGASAKSSTIVEESLTEPTAAARNSGATLPAAAGSSATPAAPNRPLGAVLPPAASSSASALYVKPRSPEQELPEAGADQARANFGRPAPTSLASANSALGNSALGNSASATGANAAVGNETFREPSGEKFPRARLSGPTSAPTAAAASFSIPDKNRPSTDLGGGTTYSGHPNAQPYWGGKAQLRADHRQELRREVGKKFGFTPPAPTSGLLPEQPPVNLPAAPAVSLPIAAVPAVGSTSGRANALPPARSITFGSEFDSAAAADAAAGKTAAKTVARSAKREPSRVSRAVAQQPKVEKPAVSAKTEKAAKAPSEAAAAATASSPSTSAAATASRTTETSPEKPSRTAKKSSAGDASTGQSPACREAAGEVERARNASSDADRLFYYRRALRLCREMPQYHVELGKVYASIGRIEEAQSEFKQALEIDPDNTQAQDELTLLMLDNSY